LRREEDATMENDKRRLLTISQAAALLGINQKTLRSWADRGLVAHERTPTGYRRFDRAIIEEFIEEMTHDAGAEGKAAA
jgi:excisionase family DNA binding protein